MESLSAKQQELALKVAAHFFKDLEEGKMVAVAEALGCSEEELQELKAALEVEGEQKEKAPVKEKEGGD